MAGPEKEALRALAKAAAQDERFREGAKERAKKRTANAAALAERQEADDIAKVEEQFKAGAGWRAQLERAIKGFDTPITPPEPEPPTVPGPKPPVPPVEPVPANGWQLVASDPTLWMNNDILAHLVANGSAMQREAAKRHKVGLWEGEPALEHKLTKGGLMVPLSGYSPVWACPEGAEVVFYDFELFIPEGPFQKRNGKYSGLMGGRGAAGGKTGVRDVPGAKEGCSTRVMHPNGTGIGAYAYFKNKDGSFGDAFKDDYDMPRGRFVKVGTGGIIGSDGKSDGAAFVSAEGKIRQWRKGINWPAPAWRQGLWIVINSMNGGNPEDERPECDCRQFFRNGRVFVGSKAALEKGLPE